MNLFSIFLTATFLFFAVSWVVATINHERMSEGSLSLTLLILGWVFLIFGCIVYPVFVPIENEYVELHSYEYELCQGEHFSALIAYNPGTYDANLFPAIFSSAKFKEAIEDNPDSVKFYIRRHKSLAGLSMGRFLVWSHYPHNVYLKE